MSTEKSGRRIYLIYSADRPEAIRGVSRESAFDRIWSQLEMFPTASPDTLLFVTASDSDIFDVLGEINARHIFDLRDVPYLTLCGKDRKAFLRSLESRFVDYASVHAFLHDAGQSSVLSLLTELSERNAESIGRLQRTLATKLSSGPTVVLCDKSPRTDANVGALLDFLSRQHVKHSPVLALH